MASFAKLQGFTRAAALPSGWKQMSEQDAMGAVNRLPQWAQQDLRGVVGRYFKGKATAAPTAPAGTAGAGGMSPGARSAYEKALAHYAPGGGFGAGVEAGLERGRVKATAGGMQSLVSAGLAGTTMAAGLGKKYEEEVGAPTRARVEGARAEAIANIQMSMAGTEQRGYESAQDRVLRLQMQQTDIEAQQSAYNTQLMAGISGSRSRERIAGQQSALELALAKLRGKTQPSGPTTHKAPAFSFDDTQKAGSAYAASLRTRGGGGTAAAPMYTAIGTGTYLGGGKYLAPSQVGYGN